MPAPKRRAGETNEEFNRRRVAYYANRRALNDAFYNDEEDVDIRDLTADSPESRKYSVSDIDEDWDSFVKSNARKPSRLRNPANSNRFYAEDRRQSSRRPSGDIWDGLDRSEYVHDDFTVDDSWVRKNADTAESSRRNPAMKAFRGRVLEENSQNISAPMKGIMEERADNTKSKRFSGTRGERASTSVTNNTPQDGKTKTVREGTISVAKSNPRQALEDGFRRDRADNYGGRFKGIAGRAALTPGDYTRNIGRRNETGPSAEDLAPTSRRPRRVVEGGKGIKQNGPASSLSEDRILGGEDRILGGTKNRDRGSQASTNTLTVGKSSTRTTRDGTLGRMGTRQALEDGFNEEKKKKSGSTGFRGIRP